MLPVHLILTTYVPDPGHEVVGVVFVLDDRGDAEPDTAVYEVVRLEVALWEASDKVNHEHRGDSGKRNLKQG